MRLDVFDDFHALDQANERACRIIFILTNTVLFDMTTTAASPEIKVQDVTRSQPSLLTEGVIMLAAALIFFKDYFIMTVGVRVEIIGIGILFTLAIFSAKKIGYFKVLPGWHYLLLLVVSAIAVISSTNSGVINSSSYFASFVVATLIVMVRPQHFLKSMTLLMSFNFLLQLVEVLAGQFIFVYVDDEYEYDEKMLGVGDDSFRAKGLFGSPLNAISIALSLAFLNPRYVYGWILLILSSSLGQGRLGLSVGLVGLLVALLNQANASMSVKFQKIFLGALSIVGAVILSIVFGSEESIDRLLSAASPENSQNVSRLLIWGVAISQLLDYDVLSHLFGNYGLIKKVIGGTESDWLRLWLDNGLFFFLLYFVPLVIGLVRNFNRRYWPEFFAYGLLIFVMAVYPHGQSMPNGTLLWLTILVTLYGNKSVIDSRLVNHSSSTSLPTKS